MHAERLGRNKPFYHVLVASLVIAAVFALHACYYYPFLADDALISLRYSERLLAGHGLTWNDGEYVEGYTNLLWVLANSGVGALGIDLVLASRILGILSTVGIVGSLFYYLKRTKSESKPAAVFLYSGLFLALSPPIAIWSIGGLENTFLACFVAYAVARILLFLESTDQESKSLFSAAFALGLATLTRADAPLLVVGITLAVLLFTQGTYRQRIMACLMVAGIPLLFFLAQTAFRIGYYGDVMPNTYYAKFAYTGKRILDGFGYWKSFLLPLSLPFAIIFTFIVWPLRSQSRGLISTLKALSSYTTECTIAIICAIYGGYVLASGGDIFPGYRHGVVVLTLLAFMFARLLTRIFAAPHTWPKWITHLCLLAGLWGYVFLSHNQDMNRRAKLERWEWSCKEVAEELKGRWSQYHPVMAVATAGCLPYFSQFTAIDMFGLNDKYLAHNRPENFGYGRLGHELMNPTYILNRQPEIIIFRIGDSPEPDPSFQPLAAFHQHYTLYSSKVSLSGRPIHLWLRNDFYRKVHSRSA